MPTRQRSVRSCDSLREFIEPPAFCYPNAERTSRMLELVRLVLNRADDPTAYAAAIRVHLDANGGRLTRQGSIRLALVDGIAHVPDDAIQECRTSAAS